MSYVKARSLDATQEIHNNRPKTFQKLPLKSLPAVSAALPSSQKASVGDPQGMWVPGFEPPGHGCCGVRVVLRPRGRLAAALRGLQGGTALGWQEYGDSKTQQAFQRRETGPRSPRAPQPPGLREARRPSGSPDGSGRHRRSGSYGGDARPHLFTLSLGEAASWKTYFKV